MPLHRARNYRKLVGDVYNCCGFNPIPSMPHPASLQQVSQAICVHFDFYRRFYLYRFMRCITESQVKRSNKIRNFLFRFIFSIKYFLFSLLLLRHIC